jgi:Flp pilus assembly protein TadD
VAYYVAGDYARAEAFFRAAVAVRPANPAAVHGLGITIMRSGDAARAVPVLRKAVALDPSAPLARNSFAWALRETGATGEAMRVLSDGIARVPDAPALSRHLGWIHCQVRKDYNTGILLLRKAVELAPGDAQNHDELGWCLLDSGKPEAALPSLKKAVELAKEWPHPRFLLARALRETGDEQDAREQLRIAASLGRPQESPLARATALLNKRDYDAAIAAFKEVIEQEPNNAVAHNNLAVCYVYRGKGAWTNRLELAGVNQADVTEAITHLQKAVAIADANTVAHANLGWCLFLKGRFDDAIAELEKARKLDPNTPWIKDRLEFVQKAKDARDAGPGGP